MIYPRQSSWFLFLIATGIFCTGSFFVEEFQFDYQKTIETKKPVLLNLELVKGKVAVSGSSELLAAAAVNCD